jgi:uncharacterized protein (TIGR02453 family)
MTFTGFPVEAFDFYEGLQRDNTKSYWTANKNTYDEAVRAPLVELTEELAEEFGEASVFRPYRDVRFSADKSPYKTHLGAFVEVAPSTGYYLQVSSAGVLVAGGFHDSTPGLLGAVRDAIADERTGPRAAATLDGLTEQGWTLGGEKLKTAPRGVPRDHPRIELLRHKQITLERGYGRAPVTHTPGFVERVRHDWRELRPFLEWLAAASTEVGSSRR